MAANGESAAHDLFALTDEQILEIEPQGEVVSDPSQKTLGVNEWRVASQEMPRNTGQLTSSEQTDGTAKSTKITEASPSATSTDHEAPSAEAQRKQVAGHEAQPPEWLARQMKDPWAGDEAREFWEGVQRAQGEAAAYRAAFATPAEAAASKEDVRALKELYPGGAAEARAAAERARVLDEIDRAYFGAQGAAPAETSASRAQLAARMMQEDPAAFREMVMAGLQVLQQAEKPAGANELRLARVAAGVTENARGDSSTAGREDTGPTPASAGRLGMADGKMPREADASAPPRMAPNEARRDGDAGSARVTEEALARYTAFEKAANEDLEKSVGGAIERTIEKALPAARQAQDAATVGARSIVPLHERLAAAVRTDVEAALKNDRQLGEQVAQVLSARRFDDESRAQVVRLIHERARQLVPVAAKRVLNEWTQTTLAAHRGKTQATSNAGERMDLAPDVAQGLPAQSGFSPEGGGGQRQRPENAAGLKARATAASQRVDYRKLSDEQILEL